MNPRELEEKLEKDNLTLKEHILKLQQTIKQIKSEMMKEDSGEEEATLNKKQVHSLVSRNKNNLKDRKNSPDKMKNNRVKEERDDDNLKFSFNVRDEKLSEKRKNSQENIKEDKKNNIYKENLIKLRKEKAIIEKTEKLKKDTNLRNKYSNDNKEEILKFQKNLSHLSLNDHNYKKDKYESNNNREEQNDKDNISFKNSNLIFNLKYRSKLQFK